ncbi:MAG: XAC2610-related protein [Longimicrobiaceae bacterium]
MTLKLLAVAVTIPCAATAACRPEPLIETRAPAASRGSGPAPDVVTADTVVTTTVTTADTMGVATAGTPARADSMRPISRDSADRCRWEEPSPRAHTGEEYWLAHWDSASMERGVPLRCVLREGEPEVRVVVRGADGIPMVVEVYFPADARTKVQTLALDNDEHASEQSSLAVGEDLNDDGWTDLRVKTWSGSGGVIYDLFTWNPQRSRFEQDSVFPGGTDIHSLDRRGCAGTVHRNGAFQSGGGEFCWSGGRWHLVRRWTADKRAERFHVRRTEEMRDGRVLRVHIDTVWQPAGSGGGSHR